VRHPRDEVAVGWPARLAQVGYALAPYPTEHLMGAGFRWALDRAEPGPRTHGALRAPTPEGTRADGGWRARKHVPDAGTLSTALGTGLAAAGACAALLAGLAAARRFGARG
jgi:hypothetical protein